MADRKPKVKKPKGMPSREAIIAFMRENPEQATKREIARAFNLKGDNRVALKHLLRELEEDGTFEKRGKRLASPGALPPTAVLEISGRDRDGGLMAMPVAWDVEADGPAPLVALSVPRNPRAKIVIPGIGDRVLARITRQGEGYTGRVIKRLEKPQAATLAVVRKLKSGGYRLMPVERRDEELDIEEADLSKAQDGDLVEIDVTKVGRYGLKKAKVSSVIGSLSSEKAVSMIAIHAHDIPHVFPSEVFDEAASAKPPALTAPREDWRDVPLITIDPADAKDHDDAVYAEPDPSPANAGGHIVTVAIADVAHFVRSGSALDKEALKRANSVYFPDRVVPMLPERISNDLCSLREGVDRPAMAVRMVFDAQGHKIDHRFHRIMMRSHAKLAYEQAQAAIDGEADAATLDVLETILKPLWAAYATMLKGRNTRQPLELDLPERKIKLNEDGTVDKIVIPPRLDAHKLIEECMIQANVAAAETLERAKQDLVFRVHDSPSLAKQEALREFLKTMDISLAQGAQLRPAAFNQILSKVAGTDTADLVNSVVLRSQSQAEYSPDNYGHFGLNLARYAHFTSPIRRYADLIVHRALIAALDLGDDGATDAAMEGLRDIAAHISKAERRASNAERDTVDRLIALHLEDNVGATYDGRISGVVKSGLFVALTTYGTDGFIPASSLGSEFFHHDEGLHAMIGERSGKGYRLGDSVEVKIAEVAGLSGTMRFDMETEPRDLGFSRQSRHKSRRAAARRPGTSKAHGGPKGRSRKRR